MEVLRVGGLSASPRASVSGYSLQFWALLAQHAFGYAKAKN